MTRTFHISNINFLIVTMTIHVIHWNIIYRIIHYVIKEKKIVKLQILENISYLKDKIHFKNFIFIEDDEVRIAATVTQNLFLNSWFIGNSLLKQEESNCYTYHIHSMNKPLLLIWFFNTSSLLLSLSKK